MIAASTGLVFFLLFILGGQASRRPSDTISEDGTPRLWSGASPTGPGAAIQQKWALALQSLGTGATPTSREAYQLVEQLARGPSSDIIRLMAAACLGTLSKNQRRAYEVSISKGINRDPKWTVSSTDLTEWPRRAYAKSHLTNSSHLETWLRFEWK